MLKKWIFMVKSRKKYAEKDFLFLTYINLSDLNGYEKANPN